MRPTRYATIPGPTPSRAWEGPIVAAADATALSLRDWAANLLSGRNLSVGGGVGALVLRRLAQPLGRSRCARRRRGSRGAGSG